MVSFSKLVTINSSQPIPDVAVAILKKFEGVGENQFVDFIRDRLVYGKVSICETIPKNEFSVWHSPEVDPKTPFTPSNSDIVKMRSACEHRPYLANAIFSNEILNVPQSLCKAPDRMYHGSKALT